MNHQVPVPELIRLVDRLAAREGRGGGAELRVAVQVDEHVADRVRLELPSEGACAEGGQPEPTGRRPGDIESPEVPGRRFRRAGGHLVPFPHRSRPVTTKRTKK